METNDVFVRLFTLSYFVFPNKMCLGGKVLLSVLSSQCETPWLSSFSFAAVFHSEHLFIIMMGWSTWSPKKKWFFPKILLRLNWLVFSSLPPSFLKASTTIWETEEKYGLPYLLISSRKYFLVLVSGFHPLCICLVQFFMIPHWISVLSWRIKFEGVLFLL